MNAGRFWHSVRTFGKHFVPADLQWARSLGRCRTRTRLEGSPIGGRGGKGEARRGPRRGHMDASMSFIWVICLVWVDMIVFASATASVFVPLSVSVVAMSTALVWCSIICSR